MNVSKRLRDKIKKQNLTTNKTINLVMRLFTPRLLIPELLPPTSYPPIYSQIILLFIWGKKSHLALNLKYVFLPSETAEVRLFVPEVDCIAWLIYLTCSSYLSTLWSGEIIHHIVMFRVHPPSMLNLSGAVPSNEIISECSSTLHASVIWEWRQNSWQCRLITPRVSWYWRGGLFSSLQTRRSDWISMSNNLGYCPSTRMTWTSGPR